MGSNSLPVLSPGLLVNANRLQPGIQLQLLLSKMLAVATTGCAICMHCTEKRVQVMPVRRATGRPPRAFPFASLLGVLYVESKGSTVTDYQPSLYPQGILMHTWLAP